jgi:Glycosyl transferase family 2
VTTEFVAFLDDDDTFMPEHLEKLREAQLDSGADVVYSMPFIPQLAAQGGIDPSGMWGAPFDTGRAAEHHGWNTSGRPDRW